MTNHHGVVRKAKNRLAAILWNSPYVPPVADVCLELGPQVFRDLKTQILVFDFRGLQNFSMNLVGFSGETKSEMKLFDRMTRMTQTQLWR